MKNYLNLPMLLAPILMIFLFAPLFNVQAQPIDPREEFQKTVSEGGLVAEKSKIPEAETVVQNVVNIVLGFVGVAAFLVVIYAGGLWITAYGREAQTKKAKDLMLGAVIGLVVIFTAYFLVNFVITQLGTAVTSG